MMARMDFLQIAIRRNYQIKILALLQNPNLAKSLGNAGRKKVEQDFTWQKLAKKTMTVYKYALGDKKSL